MQAQLEFSIALIHPYRKERLVRKWLAVVAGAAVASVVMAATFATVATSATARHYRIALVTGQQGDPFYVTMAAGAQAEAKKLGVALNWQAPAQFDPSVEIPILDSILGSKPDFLIAVPDDAKALVAEFKKFNAAKIPLVTADTDVVDKQVRLGNYTSNNELGGVLAAKKTAAALHGKGKVFLLCDPPGITTDALRKQGFEMQIKHYSGIKYLGAQIYNGSDTTDAARVMSAMLARNPDLAGVVTCDGGAGLGASTALNEAGKAGHVKLISFDAGPDLVSALKRGTVSGLMIQQSYNIGATAVREAVSYLKTHRRIPAETLFPYVFGSRANISNPAITKFFAK